MKPPERWYQQVIAGYALFELQSVELTQIVYGHAGLVEAEEIAQEWVKGIEPEFKVTMGSYALPE